MFTLFHWEG